MAVVVGSTDRPTKVFSEVSHTVMWYGWYTDIIRYMALARSCDAIRQHSTMYAEFTLESEDNALVGRPLSERVSYFNMLLAVSEIMFDFWGKHKSNAIEHSATNEGRYWIDNRSTTYYTLQCGIITHHQPFAARCFRVWFDCYPSIFTTQVWMCICTLHLKCWFRSARRVFCFDILIREYELSIEYNKYSSFLQ